MNEIDPDTRAAVESFLDTIKQYDVIEAYLYGSRARGDHGTNSDADVAVILTGNHHDYNFLKVKLEMVDLAFAAIFETGILISPLPIWLDEWENSGNYSNPKLLENIRREGVRVGQL
ncbi:MAG: nucleotidyltransferase domain-containing protein [Methylophaga sp.]|nr:nucleotidyltransferase domain-containing protein [Methylophaga sp.]